MTKEEAERETIRRWYMLPEQERDSYEAADAYAYRLDLELDFHTVTLRRRLIGAWLIREVSRSRAAEKQAKAA
jgi:hypothetical protein